jgi:hypothetical protein
LSAQVRAELFYLQTMQRVNLEYELQCQLVALSEWRHTQSLSHLIITVTPKSQNG